MGSMLIAGVNLEHMPSLSPPSPSVPFPLAMGGCQCSGAPGDFNANTAKAVGSPGLVFGGLKRC